MPRFAANIAYLFSERPLIERPGAAAAGGFAAVEGQFPYTTPASALGAETARHGLTMLGADAGFVATGMLAPEHDEEGNKSLHRNVALTSIGIATGSYLYMLFTR